MLTERQPHPPHCCIPLGFPVADNVANSGINQGQKPDNPDYEWIILGVRVAYAKNVAVVTTNELSPESWQRIVVMLS